MLRRFVRVFTRLTLVLVLALSAGCAVRLAYNQLDWLVPWYVDGYLDLDSAQEKRFQASVDEYLAWHRREQLPLYAGFLRDMAQQAGDGFDLDELAAAQQQTERFADSLLTRMVSPVVALLGDLSDRQVEHLFKRLDEDNKAFAKKQAGSVRAQRKEAVNESRKYLERWIGSLDDEQEMLLERWSKVYEPMGKELLEARIVWQGVFKAALALRKTDPDAFEGQMRKLLVDGETGRTAALNAKAEHNGQSLVSLYRAMDASLTPAQRKRLLETLDVYAKDFDILSREK